MTRWMTRLALASLTVLAVGLSGCDSIGQDFNDFAGDLLPPSPTEAVVWAADQDPDKRRRGTLLLSNAPFGGNPPYLALYRDYVKNEANPLVRAVAIRALAKHGTPDDAVFIAPLLKHANRQVRWEAAKGLQRLHQPSVVTNLLETLSDSAESNDVRVATAVALGQYPEDRVFHALVAALDARSLALNLTAQWSLVMLTGADQGMEPPIWLTWYEQQSEPFVGRGDFLFPTYHRERSWFEQLAFWRHHVVEHPASPAGLVPPSQRRTYDDFSDDSEG